MRSAARRPWLPPTRRPFAAAGSNTLYGSDFCHGQLKLSLIHIFTGRIEVRSTNEIGQLFGAVKRMQESLTRTVATVRRGVDEINVGSREISAGNTDLSSRTEQQAASLEETAASMEELASTVKQNADNARQANQLAASASDVAERGGSAVAEEMCIRDRSRTAPCRRSRDAPGPVRRWRRGPSGRSA